MEGNGVEETEKIRGERDGEIGGAIEGVITGGESDERDGVWEKKVGKFHVIFSFSLLFSSLLQLLLSFPRI